MNENFAIQLFEGKKVRIVWDAEQEKYYFSVTDIVQVLTDSVNPRDYIKKMLRRDPELKSKWGTICPPVEMLAPDGKRRKTQAADLEGIFRIIQAIPSKKAEPVKQWLAELGSMRVDQISDKCADKGMERHDHRRIQALQGADQAEPARQHDECGTGTQHTCRGSYHGVFSPI